jgi:hypothetical protein
VAEGLAGGFLSIIYTAFCNENAPLLLELSFYNEARLYVYSLVVYLFYLRIEEEIRKA